eukprot:CAMPEP_0182473378 /NCGR_PEP_ID=MMETSP1319-20130603/23803_1 /TAXON_ID=172717 /ORGANISM="Bolidomonas pacifica, Strain RCC208" /LENGTH=71 /DNA_ID=CAMNT_0024674161 /DNA_START=416 /DNA_END=631 /DNA_ORIENTATION=-
MLDTSGPDHPEIGEAHQQDSKSSDERVRPHFATSVMEREAIFQLDEEYVSIVVLEHALALLEEAAAWKAIA